MATISLVTRNFPPLSGGMERLVFELYRGLYEEHEVRLFGPSGCEKFVDSDAAVWSTMVAPTPVFLLLSFLKGLFVRVRQGASDIIVGGSGLVGPVIVLLAKLSGAKSVLLLHGLDIIADSRVYQWVFVPFLRFADVAVCNSKNTARLAIEHGVLPERIAIVNPGVDKHVTVPSKADAKATLDVAERKVLLSVGRLMPRKGLAEFIQQSFVSLRATDPDILLLVAGSEPAHALNRPTESVLATIEAAIAEHQLQEHVRLLGHANDEDLITLYAAADVFVFPLIDAPGDVEGFGMVAIEAAMHGTPTVAFDCGGVADAVCEGKNGALVQAGDYAGFTAATEQVLAADLEQSSIEFAQQFSWENYGEQFADVLARMK